MCQKQICFRGFLFHTLHHTNPQVKACTLTSTFSWLHTPLHNFIQDGRLYSRRRILSSYRTNAFGIIRDQSSKPYKITIISMFASDFFTQASHTLSSRFLKTQLKMIRFHIRSFRCSCFRQSSLLQISLYFISCGMCVIVLSACCRRLSLVSHAQAHLSARP